MRRRPEQELQRALFMHLGLRGAPGLVAIAVPNGGARRPVEAAILKGLGVTAGAPDVLLWHAGKAYAMELKAPGGTVSDSQGAMLNDLSAAGVHCAICFGLDRALACLEDWQLLNGRVQ
jgi:hypothetical protein